MKFPSFDSCFFFLVAHTQAACNLAGFLTTTFAHVVINIYTRIGFDICSCHSTLPPLCIENERETV